MPNHPKISCLTVTTDRLPLLKEAIRCYCDQTYPNREMVIVTPGGQDYQDAIKAHAQALGRDDIRVVAVADPDTCLGKMRNISVESAQGDLICQWDDDDLSHPDRLRLQWDAQRRADAEASYLSDHLKFFTQMRAMYWLNWEMDPEVVPHKRLHPGTIMAFRRDFPGYPEEGELSHLSEDSYMRDQFHARGPLELLKNHGYLFVYRFHGANCYGRGHYVRLALWSMADTEFIESHDAVLRQALDYYQLPTPYTVRSRSKTLFSYPPDATPGNGPGATPDAAGAAAP